MSKPLTLIATLALLCPLSAEHHRQYQTVENLATTPLLSPALAERKTAKIVLDNGLRAYLISDPHAEQSAAALAVKVGSWSDPEEYPGTAHFCEHLLFMGSAKYPEENGYSQFIRDNGGMLNAFTASDRTVYSFSVGHPAFAETLDRFSHFFIDPLFNPSTVGRELKAVDQEFSNYIEHDGWRMMMVYKELANPDHPYHAFNCGNSATLAKIPPSRVQRWYENHYTPERMSLVVYAPLPIEELIHLTVEGFSQIPIRKFSETTLPEKVFSSRQKASTTYIAPIKTMRSLSFNWELPTQFSSFEGKTAACFLANLVSSSVKGSLNEYLKNAHWIEGMQAGAFPLGNDSLFFSIDLELTPLGIAHKEEVTEAVFATLAALKEKEIPHYLIEEYFALQKLHYQNQSRENPFGYVTEYARHLVDENLETFPEWTEMGIPFSRTLLKKVLYSLTPDQCITSLCADPTLCNISLDQKEPWTATPYTVIPAEKESIDNLATLESLASYQLPPPNPYIPTNLNLVARTEEAISTPIPTLISDQPEEKIYFAQDQFYHTPDISFILDISSTAINSSAKTQVLLSLFQYCAYDELEQLLSQGSRAGISAAFAPANLKLNVRVSGYAEKATLFSEQLFSQLCTLKPSPEIFARKKALIIESQKNLAEDLPVKQAAVHLKSIVIEDQLTPNETIAAINEVTYEEFLLFCSTLFDTCCYEATLYGNLTESQAINYWNSVKTTLNSRPLPLSERRKKRLLVLPEKQGPFYVPLHSQRQGNGLILLLQEGTFTMKKRATQQVLSSALAENFFDTLRTKQQIGYIVQAWDQEEDGQLFQYFAAQSNSHRPDALLERFELFLEEFEREIETELSLSRFETIRFSLIDKLSTPPENTESMGGLLHKLAFDYDGDFLFREKRIQALQELSYEEITQAAHELFSRKNSRRLAVSVEGALAPENDFRYHTVTKEEIGDVGMFISWR